MFGGNFNMQRGLIFTRQSINLLILFSILASFSFAQKASARPKATSCLGAWTGNVTYARSQDVIDNKTVKRNSGRGEDKKSFETKFRYKASVGVLEDPTQPGSNIGKASIESSLTSTDKTTAREENSCDRGKTWKMMSGEFMTKSETRGQMSNQPANVTISMNSDGSYGVSVGLPQIYGMISGTETASYSGQCTTKPGKNITMPHTPTTIQGQSMTTDGRHRVDPKDPNKLSGSFSQTALGVTETITWNLQRCDAPLRITDIQFEDMKFPYWNDWQDISEQRGTIDGNFVKIKARILNESGETKYADLRFKETYKGDKWDGARPDAPLDDNVRSIRVGANSEETVELIWDSSGYAWFDDGRPRLQQRIKAELEENGRKIDEKTENLKVAPKPIVFVPGVFTNADDADILQNLLTTTHSYGWKTYRTIDVSRQGTIAGEGTVATNKTNKSVYDNADNLEQYVRNVRSELNAWHIDMLAHSTGGLVARLYIHKQMENVDDGRPMIKHLMMLGSPNLGMPCADSIVYRDAFKNSQQTVVELMPEQMAIFNRHVTEKKGVRFSALVGDSVPIFCTGPEWNDEFVSVESAKYGVTDFAITKSRHSRMINAKTFGDFVRPHVVTGPKGTYPFPIVSEN